MICHLIEREHEEKAWSKWLVDYQHMDKDNFVSFSEFLKSLKPKIVSEIPAEDILKNASGIMRSLGR